MRPDSDIDLLIVARNLPKGRMKRGREFDVVERALEEAFRDAGTQGIDTRLSPIFKSPEEAEAGSPLCLDMVEDSHLLCDGDGVF